MAHATATSRKVQTPFGILSYPILTANQLARAETRAKADPDQSAAKYSATLVFPAGTDLSAMRAAAELAFDEFFCNGTGKYKAGSNTYTPAEALAKGLVRSPFRTDTEAKGYPDGSTFVSAKSQNKIGIVHPNREQMTEAEVADLCYPGCWMRASITFFGYTKKGNKGITAALDSMQWVKNGDRLDNRVSAVDEFTALDSAPDDISALVG